MTTKIKLNQIYPVPVQAFNLALTGTPTAPTPNTDDDSTKISTTAYVQNNLNNYVDLSSSQTISGSKTFSSDLNLAGKLTTNIDYIKFGNGKHIYLYQNGTNRLDIQSCNNNNVNDRTGHITFGTDSSGNHSVGISAINVVNNNTSWCTLTLNANADGTTYTSAPTPATSDNSTKIATTAYVKACVPKSIGDANTPVYTNSDGVITSTGKSFANYLPLSGGTITNCKEGYNSVSVSTSTASIDFSTKNFYFLTLSSATTLTFTNTLTAGNGTLRIITLAIRSNGYSVTWNTSVSWADGITPVLTTDKTDVFNFIEGISGIWGIYVGSF